MNRLSVGYPSLSKDVWRHSSIKSFTATPLRHDDAGLHEAVFALPRAGKPDALDAERLAPAKRPEIEIDWPASLLGAMPRRS